MKYTSIMHIAFYTDKMEEMIAFYCDKLGARQKALVRYGAYIDSDDRPDFQKIAKEDPERIFNTYIEIADGQFIELFPAVPDQKEHTGWNEHKGYSHFALLVDDIFKTRQDLEAKGVIFDTDISKGPSETYKMWVTDPDGNRFEIMQYTADSVQIKGNIS